MRNPVPPSALVLVAAVAVLTGCSFRGGVALEPVAGPAPAVGWSVDHPTPDPGAPAPAVTAPSPSPASPTASPAASPTAPPVAPPVAPPSSAPAVTASAPAPVPTRTRSAAPAPAHNTTAPSRPPAATPVPSAAPVPSPPPARITTCTSAQLVAALTTDPAATGSATGSATVTLTNTGAVACHLKGFGGIALSRSDGTPVLSRQQRTGAAAASLTLAPGGRARSTITWSRTANPAVGEPATGDCEPVPTALLVIPPDQIADLAVPWNAGPVCDQGTIGQSPYSAS